MVEITPAPAKSSVATSPPATKGGVKLWDDNGAGFGDALDVVNPMQQIPVISTFYRAGTGDSIGAIPRLAGGALFGGVIGLAIAGLNVLFEAVTGSDIGENIVAPDKSKALASYNARQNMIHDSVDTKGNTINTFLA